MELTLQAYVQGAWNDAFSFTFTNTERGRAGALRVQPLHRYATAYFGAVGAYSFCAIEQVNPMDTRVFAEWPALLDDLMPTGYARELWINMLGLQNAERVEQDIVLLQQGVIAPVGNLRFKESIDRVLNEYHDALEVMRFPLQLAVERDHDFLAYARQRGAISGGATGAGGAAPKMLMRRNANNEIWIDTLQQDTLPDQHYLVKFPRNLQSIDQDILRAEYHYYHELTDLGFNTIEIENMQLIEGARHPSLWLPRFDRQYTNNRIERYGVESIFSLLNKPSGSFLRHEQVLNALIEVVNTTSTEALVAEYIQRDMLNVAFGNSDNHGRNTALLKKEEHISLAPIFDFAPMKADPEQIIRTTTWGTNIERGGEIDWLALCEQLWEYGEPMYFQQRLAHLAQQLIGLESRLRERGVPEQILGMPAMGFARLNRRIESWGLL